MKTIWRTYWSINLDHEEERRAIAAAGQRKVANYSYEELWDGQVRVIGANGRS